MSDGQRKYCAWRLQAVAGLILCFATLLIWTSVVYADSHQVRAAALRDWPPQYQVDDSGRPSGFAIDVIENIAASGDLELTFKVVASWEEALTALKTGQIDLIPNLGITPERQKWFAFTSPVETFQVVIAVRQSTMDIAGQYDLMGRVVATVQNNVGTRLMKVRGDIEQRIFLNAKNALLELMAGHVDALIYPRPVLMKLVTETGLESNVKIVGQPLIEIKRAIAVQKKNDALLQRLESTVKNFVPSKRYAQIYTKWYGQPKLFWTSKRIVLVMTVLLFILILWHNLSVTKVNRRLNQSIADQKNAEAALRASEEKYRLIVENQSDLTVKMGADGRLRFVSPSFCETFGNNAESFIGSRFITLIHPHDREKVQLAMQCLQVAPHACRHEGRAMTPSGWRWFSWSNKAIIDADGKVKKIVAVGRDTTERKDAELQLKESEEKFRAIFEQAADAVVLINKNTLSLADFNTVAHQSLGYSRETFARMNLKGLIISEPPDTTYSVIDKIMSAQDHPVEARLRDKSGQSRWFLMKHRPLSVSEGRFILGIWHDITDRKKLEEHLVHSQKMEAIGTLAGGVAHDFNNILSIIIGNTELAIKDIPNNQLVGARLKEIQTAGTRAKEVVRQLLTFSRREQEMRKPLLLGPLVDESLQLLRASIPTTIEIRKRLLSTTELAVLADPTQIHQILLNLCTNAAQAMDAKGGTIEVTLLSTVLDGRTGHRHGVSAGAYAQIRVEDNGDGIHPDVLERIFDPYFTTKKAHEGTGMGLSIVHGIVRRHNGTVDVESHPGKGTVFRVFLPLSKLPSPAKAEVVEKPATGNERVLLVDDEPSLAKLGGDFLKQLGYRAQAFDSAPDALAAFKANPSGFDLIITDMTMPKMTGEALVKEIFKIRPGFPVILCSGHHNKSDEASFASMGIKAFLQKPYKMKTLASTIRQVLSSMILH